MAKKTKAKKKRSKVSTVSELLAAAEASLCQFPPDELKAYALLQEAVKSASGNSECLSALGELLCTAEHPAIRDEEAALDLFKKSLQIDPIRNPERYFYVGQLLASSAGSGKDAEISYKEGIMLLQNELVRNRISNAKVI